MSEVDLGFILCEWTNGADYSEWVTKSPYWRTESPIQNEWISLNANKNLEPSYQL